MARRNACISAILWAITALFLMNRRRVIIECAALLAANVFLFRWMRANDETDG
ncbi:hypothetical protein M3N64_00230 [Sporolactobacillus sp. CPB3-1]|uniref:Uncharacterized protein n=1 Tax=Sporolactobacillus mangiferae TaxID=2940498 RepID=A0ABT0M6U1_9BACL|nr:hypothetical protein [Sporolactobacillus mangiferae]MCL1630383.1 hypothetical protein [Sporolactobacillus mangiferae]